MIKKNCFAYDSTKEECTALLELVCKKKDTCRFYASRNAKLAARVRSAKRREGLGMCLTAKEKRLLEGIDDDRLD